MARRRGIYLFLVRSSSLMLLFTLRQRVGPGGLKREEDALVVAPSCRRKLINREGGRRERSVTQRDAIVEERKSPSVKGRLTSA